MKTTTKHLLSCCTLVVFALLALSSRVNKIPYRAFNYGNKVEEPADNFLLKNDGTKVYGSKISWKSGLLVKDQIKIDDQKFKLSEVRGYLSNGIFYGRLGNDYIKRIVHGKINVYVQFREVTSTSTPAGGTGFTHTTTYTVADQYGQKGENGPLFPLANKRDIKDAVAGCPLAEDMADKSYHQIRKAIRNNRNYLNNIFDVYNNNCKPVGDSDSAYMPRR
jgi:hypothetical protein